MMSIRYWRKIERRQCCAAFFLISHFLTFTRIALIFKTKYLKTIETDEVFQPEHKGGFCNVQEEVYSNLYTIESPHSLVMLELIEHMYLMVSE